MVLAVPENANWRFCYIMSILVSLVLRFHMAYHNDLSPTVVHAETLHSSDKLLLSLYTQSIRANGSVATGCKSKPWNLK